MKLLLWSLTMVRIPHRTDYVLAFAKREKKEREIDKGPNSERIFPQLVLK